MSHHPPLLDTSLGRIFATVAVAVSVASPLGCANLRVGEPIPLEKVQQIRGGLTTKDRVLSLFGEPLRKVPGEDGEIWVYHYLDGQGTHQEFVVSFTGNHVSTFTHG